MLLALALLVGAYYLLCARAMSYRFELRDDLYGYYNYLGRAFAHGHLYIEIEPSPKLLALPDPYDPSVDRAITMRDMAFFRGRYYLYHGAVPAVLLFTPWWLVTGHDAPEPLALALFCFAGFLFSAGTLLRVLSLAQVETSTPVLAVMLIALGVCQGVPYLLNRVDVYEIAIGGAYCCLSAAFFFLARSLGSARSRWWLAASGLMFGLSIGCRPHLGLAAVIASIAVAVTFRRKGEPGAIVPFLVPLVAAGAAIASYNFLRFGNPFEFGMHYMLGLPGMNRTELAGRWVLPGLYYFLVCPPDFSAVFPWIRLVFRYPLHIDTRYFLEPTAGCIFLAPFLIGILFVQRLRGARMLLAVALASSTAVLLFIAGTGFTTQRYEVDFLPLFVLGAAAGFAVAIARATGWRRRALTGVLMVLVAAGVVANVALGLAGPNDDFLKDHPRYYARVASWFSPIERFQPLLDPRVDIEFTAVCTPHGDGFREPLLAMGQRTFREIRVLEHHPGKFRLITQSESSSAAQEIDDPRSRPLRFRITYRPDTRKLAVSIDDREVLTHDLKRLFTAPAQVTVGENRIAPYVSAPVFTGRVERLRTAIGSSRNFEYLPK